LELAFNKRLSPVLPKPDRDYLRGLKKFVRKYLKSHFHPVEFVQYDQKLFEAWLEKCEHYSQSRKEQLRRCFFSLQKRSFILNKKDFEGESFVKSEFYPEAKCLRFINSRSDEFKSYLGPYIKMIEEQVYRDPHFVKGLRIDKLPEKLVTLSKWDWILETDYSSFESSFAYEYTKVVEQQFLKFFLSKNPKPLSDALKSYTLKGKERVQRLYNHNYDIAITGCRLSGELWTSLCNGFSNLMNMMYLCERKGIEADGFVEGDDGLFGMNNPALTDDDFAKLGFKIKMEYENVVQNTTFCGNTFTDESLKLLVNPEQIGRLFWTCNQQYLNARPKTLKGLMKSKAASLYVTGRFTPIAGAVAYSQLLRTADVSFIDEHQYWNHEVLGLFHQLSVTAPVISYHDRYLYNQKFGIPLSDQLVIEQSVLTSDLSQEIRIPYQFMVNSAFENTRVKH
jgi:hypothetical protein